MIHLKNCITGLWIITITTVAIPAVAQNKNDTSAKEPDPFEQMIDYSRPGKYHQLLANLAGNWTFKGSRFEWIDSVTSKASMDLAGSLTRKPFANGRFFIAEISTRDKIELPVQDGKMIIGKGMAIQTEGYDNVKKKFVFSYINNHIGSGITSWEGDYDSTKKTIMFDSEMENIPGIKIKIRFLFIFNDNDHYKWEYYVLQNGKYQIENDMNFSRVK